MPVSHASELLSLHALLAARFPGVPVGKGDRRPRLHLYHAPNSICAQKVRAVLAQTGEAYVSHSLNIFRGESYDPAYVRLRMTGCAASGLDLARRHLGTTSVASAGCDACVVPTLVDIEEERVIIDSRRICMELDSSHSNLSPANLRPRIETELAIVDDLPNYQLLAPGVGAAVAGPKNAFAVSKVARCDALLAEHANDAALCAAYDAKRAKEQMAADRLFDAEALKRAQAQMLKALRDLDARLSTTDGPFLFGDIVTMADLFWGVELTRCEDLGLSPAWSGGQLTRLARYCRALSALPAVVQAVLEWPGARLERRPDLEVLAAA